MFKFIKRLIIAIKIRLNEIEIDRNDRHFVDSGFLDPEAHFRRSLKLKSEHDDLVTIRENLK